MKNKMLVTTAALAVMAVSPLISTSAMAADDCAMKVENSRNIIANADISADVRAELMKDAEDATRASASSDTKTCTNILASLKDRLRDEGVDVTAMNDTSAGGMAGGTAGAATGMVGGAVSAVGNAGKKAGDMAKDTGRMAQGMASDAANSAAGAAGSAGGSARVGADANMSGNTAGSANTGSSTMGSSSGSADSNANAGAQMSGSASMNTEPRDRLGAFDTVRVDELVGQELVNDTGEKLGEVDELVSDGDTVYAVVGVGGFLGIGDRDVIVPLDQLKMKGEDVVMNGGTEASIKQMQRYEGGDQSGFVKLDSDSTIGAAIH